MSEIAENLFSRKEKLTQTLKLDWICSLFQYLQDKMLYQLNTLRQCMRVSLKSCRCLESLDFEGTCSSVFNVIKLFTPITYECS